jgi:aspartate/methionine/tyrosine aminotransferase
VRAFEGVARSLPVGAEEQFQPTLDMVRAAWGPRTRGLLLGSPSNPTGTLISKGELEKIAHFIAGRGGVLLVDEIYQGLVYGTQPWSAVGFPGDVVIINSFSKYFCMTGWRLGWVVLPENAVRSFEKLGQHLFISAPAAAQHAAIAAFSPESLSILEGRRSEFAARRDFLVPELKKSGLRIPAEPHGAFYVYADCGRDSRSFSLDLLQREAVAATPGIDFGANGTDRFVRFAYTRSMEDLEEAARRIARFAASAPSA